MKLAEFSQDGYDKERCPSSVMLKSVDALRDKVSGPLEKRCGSEVRVLTTELHGDEVRGLAFSPGRVVRYVLDAQTNRLRTSVMLRLTRSTRQPAA
jgi:hypothetical protein